MCALITADMEFANLDQLVSMTTR